VNISVVLSVLGVVITILLAAAGAVGTWAALRVGRNAQTLTNYRDAAGSWKERSEAQESEISELRGEVVHLKAENAELRGQMTVLRDLFKSAVSELANSTSNREVLDRIETMTRGIQERGDPT
jgi:predicted  nucleic acid-binding Zn-ribbon protein